MGILNPEYGIMVFTRAKLEDIVACMVQIKYLTDLIRMKH